MSTTTTTRACDACGEPALYTDTLGTDDLCDECAREKGARRHGEACAALEAIGFGVSLARSAGVDDAQIRQAVESILAGGHSIGSYPVGGDDVLGGDCRTDRPWARTLWPLDGRDA